MMCVISTFFQEVTWADLPKGTLSRELKNVSWVHGMIKRTTGVILI